MCSTVFKQQEKRNLSWALSDPLRLLATLSRNFDVTAGIDFYIGAGEESVREPSRAFPQVIFSAKFIGRFYVNPPGTVRLCRLKCDHKLDPFATKS